MARLSQTTATINIACTLCYIEQKNHCRNLPFLRKQRRYFVVFAAKDDNKLGNWDQVELPRPCPCLGETMAIALQPSMEAMAEKKFPTKQRRVGVTGMGVETSIGHTPDEFYNNLLEGASGISEIEAFDCSNYPTRIAGEIKTFCTDGWVTPKFAKRMDRFMLYILTSGKKALADAGITEDSMNEIDKTKCGILIGSAMGGMKVFNDGIEALRVSHRKLNPFCVPFATTNMGLQCWAWIWDGWGQTTLSLQLVPQATPVS